MKKFSDAKDIRGRLMFHNRRGAGCLRFNSKTLVSVETRSYCPKAGTDKECPYCYARVSRNYRRQGFEKYPHDPAASRCLFEGFRQCPRELLPDFIRFFGWSDFWKEDERIIREILDLCREYGWPTLAVTRQIGNFASDLIRQFTAIHVTADARMSALEMRGLYRLRNAEPNVLIRAVVLNDDDLQRFRGHCDVLTFYHGPNKPDLGFSNWSPHRINKARDQYRLKEVLCGAYKGGCITCPHDCVGGAVQNRTPVLTPPALEPKRWSARRTLRSGACSDCGRQEAR